MPSSIADPLYERLLRAYPADRAYTRDDWTDAPMPSPVQHFLVQLLEHQCRHEVQRLRNAQTAWVEYDHPEMERAVHAFEEAMSAYAQIPRGEWPGALKQATHHVTSFLVRPTHVLTEFVFGDRAASLDLDQVHWRMGFFGPYAYLREAVAAFTTQRNLRSLRRDQFERLLARIDERLTADYTAERWLRLLDPLFKIARVATDSDKVPVRLLRTFFDEKDAAEIVRCLDAHASSGPDHVGPKALFRLIQSDRARAASPASERDASAPRPSPRPDVPPLRSTEASAAESPDADAFAADALSADAPSPQSASAQSSPAQSSPAQSSPAQSSAAQASDDPPPASATVEQIYGQGRTDDPPATDPDPLSDPDPETDPETDPASSAEAESSGPERGDGSPWSDAAGADASDRDEIWGVAGPARPAGSSAPPPASTDADASDASTPLWKRFQQGRGSASSASEQAASDGNGTPLWARFQSDRDPSPSDAASAPGETGTADAPDDPDAPPSDAGSDARTADAAGASAPSELTALEHAVLGSSNPPQRAVYVRQLFGGSMDDYRHVLNQLHAADGWGHASKIIARDVFRAHKVNIYSDAAVHFTNAVEERFRKKGGEGETR